jgi:hypothetical protein
LFLLEPDLLLRDPLPGIKYGKAKLRRDGAKVAAFSDNVDVLLQKRA